MTVLDVLRDSIAWLDAHPPVETSHTQGFSHA
jgi:hypothetical protein